MKVKNMIGLMLVVGLAMFGCSTTSDQQEDTIVDVTEDDINETDESDQNESNDDNNEADEGESNEDPMQVHTGSTENVLRTIEGMEEDVEVNNYQIDPYNIAYQLDVSFGAPKVKDRIITYSTQNDDYKIVLEIFDQTSLDSVVSDLQEKYETDGYEYIGELENTSLGDTEIKGNRQIYGYEPMRGFYAFEKDEFVLVITYHYPEEAGDGMGPLLEALRKSIKIQ